MFAKEYGFSTQKIGSKVSRGDDGKSQAGPPAETPVVMDTETPGAIAGLEEEMRKMSAALDAMGEDIGRIDARLEQLLAEKEQGKK